MPQAYISTTPLPSEELFLLPPMYERTPKAGRNNMLPLKRDAKQREQLALAVKIISSSGRLFTVFWLCNSDEYNMNT